MNSDYRFALLFYEEERDTVVEQVEMDVDWGPAVESARLDAIRGGVLDPDEIWGAPALEPIWHAGAGQPWIEGFRIHLGKGSAATSSAFPGAYFRELARSASARLIEAGKLASGDRYRYIALAFHRDESDETARRTSFSAQVVAPVLELREASLRDLSSGARAVGTHDQADPPVLLPDPLLQEVEALAREAFPSEAGGILVGHLCRDRSGAGMFLHVTAQIHARNAEADSVKLSFTSETWTDVRAALRLRRRGEIMLGWWHSHPVREWCKGCDQEKQAQCPLAGDFFSAHDRALHRTVFPRAYSIGLVANDLPSSELTFSLQGWRQGLIVPRGFLVTRSEPCR